MPTADTFDLPPVLHRTDALVRHLELRHLNDMEAVARNAEQLSGWVLQTGTRFFKAIFGDDDTARCQLERWICRGDSEFCGLLATIALNDSSPAGVIVAMSGSEVGRRRRSDFLALMGASGRERRLLLKQNLQVLANATPPIRESDFYIRSLAVDKARRGCGIGRALINAAINDGAAAGHRRFRLDVDTDNDPALALYRSCGFEAISESWLPQIGFGMYSMVLET